MNWLERARREITRSGGPRTAVTAERSLTAVIAVPHDAVCGKSGRSSGSSSGAPSAIPPKIEAAQEDYEERAAIMEFDGGLNRNEAEREACALVSKRYRLH